MVPSLEAHVCLDSFHDLLLEFGSHAGKVLYLTLPGCLFQVVNGPHTQAVHKQFDRFRTDTLYVEQFHHALRNLYTEFIQFCAAPGLDHLGDLTAQVLTDPGDGLQPFIASDVFDTAGKTGYYFGGFAIASYPERISSLDLENVPYLVE